MVCGNPGFRCSHFSFDLFLFLLRFPNVRLSNLLLLHFLELVVLKLGNLLLVTAMGVLQYEQTFIAGSAGSLKCDLGMVGRAPWRTA